MLLFLTVACSPDETTPPERLCNGSAALCDRRLDQVTLAFAHNAMNTEDEGWLAPNQHFGYEKQAAAGIRGFMLDVYDYGGLTLCHAECFLGSEPFADALARFAAILDDYPDDVFAFVIQDDVEAGPIADAFEAAGLVDRTIVPSDPWPTLGELIDADTRLLVTREQPREGAPDWYPAAYDLAWDNNYAAQTVDDFDCAVLRGDPANPIFLLNHFLTIGVGDEDLAAKANPPEVIRDHVDRCEAETGDQVNWLAVDFYDVGGVIDVVADLNARDL